MAFIGRHRLATLMYYSGMSMLVFILVIPPRVILPGLLMKQLVGAMLTFWSGSDYTALSLRLGRNLDIQRELSIRLQVMDILMFWTGFSF